MNSGNGGRWVKGQSGNPKGRPVKDRSLSAICRTFTEEAVETLVEVMRTGDKPMERVAAATVLLDRGWGRPSQQMDVTIELQKLPAIDRPALESREVWEERAKTRLKELHTNGTSHPSLPSPQAADDAQG